MGRHQRYLITATCITAALFGAGCSHPTDVSVRADGAESGQAAPSADAKDTPQPMAEAKTDGCGLYGTRPDGVSASAFVAEQQKRVGKVVVAGYPAGVYGYVNYADYYQARDFRPTAQDPKQMNEQARAAKAARDANPPVVFNCSSGAPIGRWVTNLGFVSTAEYSAPGYSPAKVVSDRYGPVELERWQKVMRFNDLSARRPDGLTTDEEAEYQALVREATEKAKAGAS